MGKDYYRYSFAKSNFTPEDTLPLYKYLPDSAKESLLKSIWISSAGTIAQSLAKKSSSLPEDLLEGPHPILNEVSARLAQNHDATFERQWDTLQKYITVEGFINTYITSIKMISGEFSDRHKLVLAAMPSILRTPVKFKETVIPQYLAVYTLGYAAYCNQHREMSTDNFPYWMELLSSKTNVDSLTQTFLNLKTDIWNLYEVSLEQLQSSSADVIENLHKRKNSDIQFPEITEVVTTIELI